MHVDSVTAFAVRLVNIKLPDSGWLSVLQRSLPGTEIGISYKSSAVRQRTLLHD